MTQPDDDTRALFEEAQRRHAARDIAGSVEATRAVIARDPSHVEALEHLATLLITRRRQYDEGLALIERAVALGEDDAGLWYSLGWCYEFAAHEIARRGAADAPDPRPLYERAAEAFRRCLALKPEGKLVGDAEDLLDHVENELQSL